MLEYVDIKPDLKVQAREIELGSGHGPKGVHVGSVDHLDGDFIKLKRTDSDDGEHHWIPVDWVEKIDDNAIYISKSEAEYKAERMDVQPLTS